MEIIGGRREADGVDDLRGVDPLQVGGGGPQLGVPELALDDVDRDAFAPALNGVFVPELVGSEAASHPGVGGQFAQFGASGG